METETEFLLRRAREEAHQAVRCEQADAADAHEAMSIRYSAKASSLLSAQDDQPDEDEKRERDG